MRRFAVAVVFFAVTIVAQAHDFPDSKIRIEKADGTELSIPTAAPASAPTGVIVEFVAPPAAIAATSAGKSSTAGYQAAFSRFRNDLGTIINGNRAGKSAIEVQVRREYFVVFNGVALDATPDVAAKLRMLPYVKRVVADGAVQALADSTNLTLIGAPKVWLALGTRGKGVTVAIIDTGIDYTHPALGQGFGPGFKVIGGWDFVNNDADPFDDNGHGTHVSGIVAGQSATITGVAPDVSLIAYKVLNSHGSGSDSDVIAAIERAADPNGDGNTSDHVDVANLSLGGGGNPDDPTSVAVDNATAAGVTFAIAAGNGGSFHAISSPGTARSAITVGASDFGDRIASFSSRGPNMKNIALKPDVVAPGVGIVSSFPGNQYVALSGTSMATPHVAGSAALLKSLHHDWTPARIKSALMNNASLIRDDIMAAGAGRIDVYAAATGTIAVDPPSLSLGLAPIELNNWTATRSLHLTNAGAQSVTFTMRSNLTSGETVTPTPSTVTIPAGGSADVSLAFAIDNSIAATGTTSFTGGGQVLLVNSASPTDVRNIQFAFTKAARATVTFDRAYPDATWINSDHTNSVSASFLDDNTSEVLMLPGVWDLLIYTPELDTDTGSISVDLISREGLSLNKDTTIALTGADVPHTITLAGQRETGEPLSGVGYASMLRIRFGGTTPGTLIGFSFPWIPAHTARVSDITVGKTLLFYEALLDSTSDQYYVIQHPPLTGVNADAALTTGGSALRGGDVQIAVPTAARGDRQLSALVSTSTGTSGLPAAIHIVDTPVVKARVFVSPDVYPGYTYGLVFSPITDGVPQYTTPLLHVVNDKLVSLSTAGLLPWTYSGSTYEFGLAPRFPSISFAPAGAFSSLRTRATVLTDMLGPLGEIRIADRAQTSLAFFDATGAKLAIGGYTTEIDSATKGRFRIEVANQGLLYPDVNETNTVSMAIDSSHTDYLPPSLTTMMMLDGAGSLVTRLVPHGSGSLLFSAADFGFNSGFNRVYQQIRGDATQVSYRYSGETAWRPLTATQVTEDAASGSGILYSVDLTSVANVDRSLVDLKFDLADAAGNTTSVTMVPAFAVGPELPPRRRAAP
jgi:subtilisin family serine protease